MIYDTAEDDAALGPVILGDTFRFQVYVTDENGAPVTASDASFIFGYGPSSDPCSCVNADLASAAPSSGSVTIEGVVYLTANVELSANETAALDPGVQYDWALRITDSSRTETIATGTFLTKNVPIRRTSTSTPVVPAVLSSDFSSSGNGGVLAAMMPLGVL